MYSFLNDGGLCGFFENHRGLKCNLPINNTRDCYRLKLEVLTSRIELNIWCSSSVSIIYEQDLI
mgnify:CR=1 FL=1